MSKLAVAFLAVVSVLLLIAASPCAQARDDTSLKSELLRLAHDWEHVKLRIIDRDSQEEQMASLAQRAEKIVKQYEK